MNANEASASGGYRPAFVGPSSERFRRRSPPGSARGHTPQTSIVCFRQCAPKSVSAVGERAEPIGGQ
jgi:hypothetical protein